MRGSGPSALKDRSADDLLAEFVSAGGEEAFGEVVRRYAAMVFSVCLRVTGNAHDAEDATQATFLTLAVQLKSGKPVNRPGPWLQQVARRAALDVRRSRKRRETHEQRHADQRLHEQSAALRDQGRNGHPNGPANGAAGTGANDIDLEKLNHVLGEELARLPAKYRMPLLSLYFGGMSRDEIAGELGLSVGTLGVRIHRGRQMLARRLSERGVAPAGRLLAGGVLAAAVAAVAKTNFAEHTAGAAARHALGHDIAASTVAHVMAALKGTAAATILAKLKGAAAVAVLVSVTLTAAAGGAAARWDEVEPHLPQALRRAVDWVRSPWRVPLPRPSVPSVPSPIADGGSEQGPGTTPRVVAIAPPRRPTPRAPERAQAPSPPHARVLTSVTPPTGSNLPASAAPAPQPSHRVATPRTPAAPAAAPAPSARSRTTPRIAGLPRIAPPAPAARADRSADPVDSAPRSPSSDPPGISRAPILHVGSDAGPAQTFHVPRGALVVEGPRGAPPPPGTAPAPVDVARGGRLRLGGDEFGGNIVQPLTPYSPRASPRSPDSVGGRPRDTLPNSMVVNGDPSRAGSIRGWGGAIGDGGAFVNNGKVIADGRGQDRVLAFIGYGAVVNSVDNAAGRSNGWFAENGGRLFLPKIPVSPGTHSYTWGDNADDPTIDMVNSVRVTLHEAQAPGKLEVSLLDRGRADVPALPAGHTFIGVWSFDAGVTRAAGVDLTVRYDDRLAASLRLDESNLKLWRFDAGEWVRINDASFSRDVQNNLLSGHADSLSFFAVSAPEPAALGMLALGSLILLRRSRRVVE